MDWRVACRVRDDDIVGDLRDVGVQDEHAGDADRGADDLHADVSRAEAGAMPAKVSENIRPMVTAGLANDVELVNQ